MAAFRPNHKVPPRNTGIEADGPRLQNRPFAADSAPKLDPAAL
jgi:hypothetical protein